MTDLISVVIFPMKVWSSADDMTLSFARAATPTVSFCASRKISKNTASCLFVRCIRKNFQLNSLVILQQLTTHVRLSERQFCPC